MIVDWPTGPSVLKTSSHSSLKISKSASRSDQFAQTTLSIEVPASSSRALRFARHWRVCSLIPPATTPLPSTSTGPTADT